MPRFAAWSVVEAPITAARKGWNAMTRTKRNSHKKIKPDQVFRAGPITLARFGRVTVFQTDWDPDTFKHWKARWPEFKAEAEGRVRSACQRLIATLRRVRSADLLATLFTRFGLGDPTTYVESNFTGGEHYVEYVANLIAALPADQLGSALMSEEDFESALADLEQLFEGAKTSAHMSIDPTAKAQFPEFRFQLILKHLFHARRLVPRAPQRPFRCVHVAL